VKLRLVRAQYFYPGAVIMLKSGNTFSGTLVIYGDGTADHPIIITDY
jgi:hypothetical protein